MASMDGGVSTVHVAGAKGNAAVKAIVAGVVSAVAEVRATAGVTAVAVATTVAEVTNVA